MFSYLFPGFFGGCKGSNLLPLLFLLKLDKYECDPCPRRCRPCGFGKGYFY